MKGREKVGGIHEKRGRNEKVPREIGRWRRRKQFSDPPSLLPRVHAGFSFFLCPVHRIIPEI